MLGNNRRKSAPGILSSFVMHPFLLAIFPVLFLFSYNQGQVPFSETLVPAGIVLGFTAVLLLLFKLLLKDSRKAGLIVSVFLLLFFSYGHIFALIEGRCRQIDGFFIHLFLLLTWLLLLIYFAYLIIRIGKGKSKNLDNFTGILNIMAFFMVSASLINIGAYQVKAQVAWRDVQETEEIEVRAITSSRPDILRDIYYVVLERYASASTLKEFYGYDNSEFINYLSNRGFYVASESQANYPTTVPSLASSLNMKYINYLSKSVVEDSNNYLPMVKMVRDYQVWHFLKNKGYKLIHMGSYYYTTSKSKYAEINFNKYLVPEFLMILYKSTMLYPIGAAFNLDLRWMQYKRMLYKFDRLAQLPNIKEPTFVLAHIGVAHPPYVFDRQGNFVSRWQERKSSREANYVEQLIFINEKLKTLIDQLLLNSTVPPIIILQADEGPYPRRFILEHKAFNWKQAKEKELRKKLSILNAYYLPDVEQTLLYPSITPVNSFRLIFNLYFDANFELLPDESYVFEDLRHPYRFFNVTDKVKDD